MCERKRTANGTPPSLDGGVPQTRYFFAALDSVSPFKPRMVNIFCAGT